MQGDGVTVRAKLTQDGEQRFTWTYYIRIPNGSDVDTLLPAMRVDQARETLSFMVDTPTVLLDEARAQFLKVTRIA